MAIDLETGGITSSTLSIDETRLEQTGNAFKEGDETISKLFSANGFSMLNSALTSSLYGIDIFGTGSPAQMLQEQYGLVFFTRPMLNLSHDNVTSDPTLSHMLNTNTLSIGRYVRAMLDPMAGWECPLVDPTNVFIPLLSNTVETLSGWQDPILDTYQSQSGLMKESWSMGDSSNKVYQIMPLSATFRNTRGNIITYLFHVWQTYISLVYSGVIDPYPEMIRYRTIDYQTRIYRLTLDNTRTYVQEISACGAAFPLVNNAGVRANFNRSTPINAEGDMYSQTWQAQGAFYFDPRMIQSFNTASSVMKTGFKDDATRLKNYRLLTPAEYKLFTYRCFPQINLTTARLEWWVSLTTYKQIMGA